MDEVLETAAGHTTGQLAARLRRLVISVDPDSAKKRYQEAVEERKLTSEANPDGTANLYGLSLPAAEAQAAMRRINRLARSARHGDDSRTIDQLRADVFLDLLSGRAHRGHRDRGVVDLKVDLTTLAGLDDNPGRDPGLGTGHRRRRPSGRRRTGGFGVADHHHRPQRDTGSGHHHPPPTDHPQRRQVEARNPTCVFPGCRMPAAQCDIDHTHPWADTHRTCTGDLEPLCRHHHVGKHQRGWKLKRIRPGTYEWTSPLGHTYTIGPDPP